eukprot:scaffold417792_cov48-Prasinocladus_malaysianus.AAC.1
MADGSLKNIDLTWQFEGLDGRGEARTWMLPLMRRHVKGARLSFWARELLPLARAMGSQAAAYLKSEAKGSAARAAVCRTLEMQIWHTLPAFANGPLDIAEARTLNRLHLMLPRVLITFDVQKPFCLQYKMIVG